MRSGSLNAALGSLVELIFSKLSPVFLFLGSQRGSRFVSRLMTLYRFSLADNQAF